MQSPREENKQPAARRSSKNAIYEPLSILKKKKKIQALLNYHSSS
jgi:hypothetical protein